MYYETRCGMPGSCRKLGIFLDTASVAVGRLIPNTEFLQLNPVSCPFTLCHGFTGGLSASFDMCACILLVHNRSQRDSQHGGCTTSTGLRGDYKLVYVAVGRILSRPRVYIIHGAAHTCS